MARGSAAPPYGQAQTRPISARPAAVSRCPQPERRTRSCEPGYTGAAGRGQSDTTVRAKSSSMRRESRQQFQNGWGVPAERQRSAELRPTLFGSTRSTQPFDGYAQCRRCGHVPILGHKSRLPMLRPYRSACSLPPSLIPIRTKRERHKLVFSLFVYFSPLNCHLFFRLFRTALHQGKE